MSIIKPSPHFFCIENDTVYWPFGRHRLFEAHKACGTGDAGDYMLEEGKSLIQRPTLFFPEEKKESGLAARVRCCIDRAAFLRSEPKDRVGNPGKREHLFEFV